MKLSAFAAAAVSAVVFFTSFTGASAEKSRTPEDISAELSARSVYVCDVGSGKVFYEQNADEKLPMGHMAKLMTALIAAEELESGELSLTDVVSVSPTANAKQGTQIWLDIGEKITVEELIKSITIGNANDACTALAEKLSGSEEAFVKRMNKRAKQLEMTNTVFSDCCGTNENTVSTAHDIAKLSRSLAKYTSLTDYFTAWIDNVGCKDIELVNNNRLVRTYKGVTGMKSCNVKDLGECLSFTAKRGEMSLCAVALGVSDRDKLFSHARELLDTCFDNYRVFSPEIADEYLQDIKVENGEKMKICVKVKGFTPTIIKAGTFSEIVRSPEIKESVKAPVKKDDVLGKIDYFLADEKLLTVEICAAEDVGVMDMRCALKKNLFNLLNMS